MKKNILKNACNAAMHRDLGHKPTKFESKPKGKFKVVLGVVIGLLVVGTAVVFAIAN